MKSDTRTFYETAVHRAIDRIFGRLDEALDLGALAKEAALSPLDFHRIFKGMIGETPLELHRRLRLERAAHELANGDAPVTRIAFSAGYETHESFTRAFGTHYGASPSAFRQSAIDARTDPSCAPRPPQVELAARSGLHFGITQHTLSATKGETIMNVDFKQLPDLRVGAVHHQGPYNRISEAFARLGQIAGPAGLIRPGAEMMALYHDDPDATPVEQLHSDAAITVPKDASLPDGLTEIRIAASRYAVKTHLGPYTGLGDAWQEFMGTWLPKSGQRIGEGPSFEIYRNTPMDTPPEKLVTEMYIPLTEQ